MNIKCGLEKEGKVGLFAQKTKLAPDFFRRRGHKTLQEGTQFEGGCRIQQPSTAELLCIVREMCWHVKIIGGKRRKKSSNTVFSFTVFFFSFEGI